MLSKMKREVAIYVCKCVEVKLFFFSIFYSIYSNFNFIFLNNLTNPRIIYLIIVKFFFLYII